MSLACLSLPNRRMRTRLYGGVAGRDREVPPMPILADLIAFSALGLFASCNYSV